jgi:hypothetical protein
MMSQLSRRMTALAVLAVTGALAASAFAQDQSDVHKRHRLRHASGDIYVHRVGRSYLDPGASAIPGTEDRYSSDSRPYSFSLLGSSFAAHSGSWDLLPNQFTAPGRDSPLFQF